MRAIVLLLALALSPFVAAQQKPKNDLPAGLSPDQVRARLGPPARVGRQLLAQRSVEHWHYGPPHNLRLTFDCPRGQTPRLVRTRPADGPARPE
jgi:hypothetical protein